MRRPVFLLNVHHGYQCGRSGWCCATRWDIPIERDILVRLESAFATGQLVPPDDLEPAGCFVKADADEARFAAVSARRADGRCVFVDQTPQIACRIHASLGPRALPVTCQVFPRIILCEPESSSVTLSHACPTAAKLLFRSDIADLRVIRDDSAIDSRDMCDGYDARTTVPPFLRPGVVFDPESRAIWEQFVLAQCNSAPLEPDTVVRNLAWGANRIRAWTPAFGSLAAYAGRVLLEGYPTEPRGSEMESEAVWRLGRWVAESVPEDLRVPLVTDAGSRVPWAGRPDWCRVVRRFVAARHFGAWSQYQGSGVRTQVAVLAATVAVLRLELGTRIRAGGANGDEALLDAIRRTDQRLVHQADGERLCRTLGRLERVDADDYLAGLGVGWGMGL